MGARPTTVPKAVRECRSRRIVAAMVQCALPSLVWKIPLPPRLSWIPASAGMTAPGSMPSLPAAFSPRESRPWSGNLPTLSCWEFRRRAGDCTFVFGHRRMDSRLRGNDDSKRHSRASGNPVANNALAELPHKRGESMGLNRTSMRSTVPRSSCADSVPLPRRRPAACAGGCASRPDSATSPCSRRHPLRIPGSRTPPRGCDS